MTSPEITDAMAEAACRAYHGLHGNNCYADCMKVALSAALPHLGAAGVAVPGWQPMETAPKDGMRVLLAWKPIGGLSEHVELGKWKAGTGWCNTYGKPFSGEPDAWAPLAPFSAPAAPIDFDDAAYNDGYADGQREATGHGAEVARAVARWLDKHLGKGNWYDEAEEGFTADDVVQALHEVVRDTAAPAAEAEPAPVAWPSGFFTIGGDARLRDCATEGCGQHVSIRIERDGTGSEHCEPCARKIAATLAAPSPSQEATAEPVAWPNWFGWRSVDTAPEDQHVILATSGGHVGEAIMLIDEDTGTRKWAWAMGPVHHHHTPFGWMPLPDALQSPVASDLRPGGFDGPTGAE